MSRVLGSVVVARLWHGRRLIATVTLAMLLAALASVFVTKPTFTGRVTLSTASSTVPEEALLPSLNDDAGRANSYSAYFSDPAFQRGVRERAGLLADVASFGASAEGESPLLVVFVTAGSPDSARTGAAALAKVYIDDVSRLRAEQRDRSIAELRDGLQAAWGDRLAGNDPSAAAAALVVQSKINALNSDTSGLLTAVLPDVDVTEDAPTILGTTLPALIAGLVFGCAAVLVGAHASRWMTTERDVRRRTGLPAVAVDLDGSAGRVVPADLTALTGSTHSTIAVAAVAGTAAGPVATALARRFAMRGDRVVLIRADLRRDELASARPGVADHLRAAQPDGITDLIVDEGGVAVIGPGTPTGDPFTLFDRERFARLVTQARAAGDVVILESPPVDGHPEAQVVNGITDRTLLVVEQDRTDAGRTVAAVHSLEQAGARVRGVVLARSTASRSRSGRPVGGRWRVALAVLAVVAALAAAAPFVPGGLGMLAGMAAVGLIAIYLGLRDPRWAYILLLTTLFLRLALPNVLPVDAFLIAFGGLVVSAASWMVASRDRRPALGVVELAMGLYLLWNLQSVAMPHEYPPLVSILTGQTLSLYRYVLLGTVIPFTTYLLCRVLFQNASAVRVMLRALLAFGAYSALVSVLQFTGPSWLIWPRYIVDSPNWPERANGVFNQPGVNGVVMITGFAIALTLAAEKGVPKLVRWLYLATAAGCAAGIYLTHTRAIYLGFVIVIVVGAIVATGYRTYFGWWGALLVVGVALNWSELTSSDRAAGGIASTNEIYDRLNGAATSIWAFQQKPWAGWGLGRFVPLNFFHHQQWSPETPWIRGLGVASHFNELGILAELGIVGLLLWVAVIALLSWKLIAGAHELPTDDITGRPLTLIATFAFIALIILGFFSDLRLFDYPTAMVFGLIGAAIGAADRDRLRRRVARIPPEDTDVLPQQFLHYAQR